MSITEFFNQLMLANASVITTDNIQMLNQRALDIYNKQELSKNEIEELKNIVMSCNILYNRTDMTVLPIEDGFYDLLLEKYKTYDPHFQVGSAVIQFRNFIENDLSNPQKIATCPIIYDKPIKRDEIHQSMYDEIMRTGIPALNRYDFNESPIEFINNTITKRTHNTEHNHPSLVGTLDKAKFVFIDDAIKVNAEKDSNVKILERDFFIDHINKGIYDASRKIRVVAELKYDGISVEGDCNLELQSARTRGDTGIGVAADITPILQGYPFKQAKCMIGEKPVGVKFEAIMTKANLSRFNVLRDRNYKNCRTAIVGLFGSSDAYLYRDLITLVPLALDRDDIPEISNRMEEIEFINRVFRSHGEPLRYCYMEGTVQQVLFLIKAFWDEAKIARDHLDFMYDGIVVSYLDEDIREKLGRKNFINKFSMAVKFDPLEKQTIFRGYTYEVGQNGQITPMIHYDPVEFFGTIHPKSSGSSFQRFTELGLKYGDIINVTYINDVMPYVSRCECDHNRKNKNPLEVFPETCPICGEPLLISDSGKTSYCPNSECPGRSIQRLCNMLSKLNIKGFANESIIALGQTHLYELVHLDGNYLESKLGIVNGGKFWAQMHQLMVSPLNDYIIMGSLGFTSMAHKKWQAILSNIKLADLYQLYLSSKTESEFILKLNASIPKLGEVTGCTIAKELPFFEKDIIEILSWGNLIDSYGLQKNYKAQIRFTGIRNEQLSELLNNAGYDADGSQSVTKKTNILLIPFEGYTSSKLNKISNDCIVVPIDEFINNMEKYIGEKLN